MKAFILLALFFTVSGHAFINDSRSTYENLKNVYETEATVLNLNYLLGGHQATFFSSKSPKKLKLNFRCAKVNTGVPWDPSYEFYCSIYSFGNKKLVALKDSAQCTEHKYSAGTVLDQIVTNCVKSYLAPDDKYYLILHRVHDFVSPKKEDYDLYGYREVGME